MIDVSDIEGWLGDPLLVSFMEFVVFNSTDVDVLSEDELEVLALVVNGGIIVVVTLVTRMVVVIVVGVAGVRESVSAISST